MADWQRQVWDDITALDGVLPPEGGSVLVVGGGLPVDFNDDVRVAWRAWGAPLGDEAGFDRIVVLAGRDADVDFALALTQMWRLLRPDGQLVVVAARPSPFGVRRTVWWRGWPLSAWKRWLRAANWLVADTFTVGFCARWARLMPWGGPVRVIVAQKRVGGTKVLASDNGRIVAKPVGVPV